MKIESHKIAGPAGRLEALLTLPAVEDPPHVAVVCHPHPLFGGTMHNKVVFHVSRALANLGWPVLRFNFRGVGQSGGSFAADADTTSLIADAAGDLRAAIAWLGGRFPRAAMCGAGFSFGSKTVLQVAESERRLERLLAVGTPAGQPDFAPVFELVSRLPQPKLFIAGDADPYSPIAATRRLFEAAAGPKQLVLVPGAGHFFEGHLDELRRAVPLIRDVGV